MTKKLVLEELNHICNEIERLSLQTVAHQKKFQFSINQFHTFCDKFGEDIASTNTGSVELTQEQIKAYRNIVQACRDYAQTFSLNMGNTWANNFLTGPCVSTATDLNTITANLHDLALVLDPVAATAFDAQSPQWLRFHILDLRAIKESLKHYVGHAEANDKVVPIMKQKLDSIDSFFKEYEDENIVQGTRIFSPIPIQSQNWTVQHSDFTCERKEGQGVSAIVYYGHMVKTNEEVAVKQLKFKKLNGPKLRSFQREIMVLANAIHPCVLKFVGATDSPPFCIVTEWMGGGSLYHELHKFHRLDATQLTICAIDIARGMQFLHSRHIIHRDLKSLNVLLDLNGHSKICDFGFAKQSKKEEELMTKNVGTPHWMAPELLGGSDTYDEKVDVYAYGIVLWEILTGDLPYDDLEPSQIIGQVLLHDARPFLPATSPAEFRGLIEKCWARDPQKRPSFDEVMKIWREGKIMMPGANRQLVMKHLQETLNASEKANDDIEQQLNSVGQTLASLYETFRKSGIPEEIVAKCWENVQSLRKAKSVTAPTVTATASQNLNRSPSKSVTAAASQILNDRSTSKSVFATTVTAAASQNLNDRSTSKSVFAAASQNLNSGSSSKNVTFQTASTASASNNLNSSSSKNVTFQTVSTAPTVNIGNVGAVVVDEDEIVYEKCCVLFLSTTLALKAAESLRTMPTNSLPRDVALSVCNLFPTGNDKVDYELLMICCKNGLAAQASLHAVSNEHIMIAFEVLARSSDLSFLNEDESRRSEVISHCVKCLSMNDADLTVSGLRFLIHINEAKKIPIDLVKLHLQSRNITLKMASYIAAAKMAQEGIQLPNEFLDIFIEKWNLELVGTAIVSACRNELSAQYIWERVSFGTLPPQKLATRIIMQVSKHEKLRPALKVWLESSPYETFDPQYEKVVNAILSK